MRERGVVGADDSARHVLGTHGLLGEDWVLARQPVQLAGQERVECEVAAVLLADEDHERRAIQPRGGDRRDRVAEPGVLCSSASAGLRAQRVTDRHRHDRALVQREHEAQVVWKPGQEGNFG